MAIFRNVKIGKHENVTVLEFGNGDIDVIEGHIKGKPHIATLDFQKNNGTKEIGDKENLNGRSSDECEDLPVLMKFDNPKSIDVIICQLKKCKKRLNENTR